jgi:hypothetical protein
VLRRFAVLAYQRTSVRETRVKQKSYKKSYTCEYTEETYDHIRTNETRQAAVGASTKAPSAASFATRRARDSGRNSGQAKVLQEKLHVRVQDYYLNGDDKRTRSDVYLSTEETYDHIRTNETRQAAVGASTKAPSAASFATPRPV